MKLKKQIMDTVTQDIMDSACSPQLEIRTPAQSYVHKYAKKHNIRVQPI